MCVILSIYQKEPRSNSVIIETIKSYAESNSDGVGILAFNDKGKDFVVKRRLKIDINEIDYLMSRYNTLQIHLRLATSGDKDENNIHFWQYGNWLFAHNGIVYDYKKIKKPIDSNKSDSFILFQHLLDLNCFKNNNKINYKRTQKVLDDLHFTGRFVLVNKKTKRIYYFGDFKAYMINKNTLIISSTRLSFGDEYKLFGVEFDSPTTYLNTDLEGIFYLDLPKKRIVKVSDDLDISSYHGGYYDYDDYGGYKYDDEKAYKKNYEIDYDKEKNDKLIKEYEESMEYQRQLEIENDLINNKGVMKIQKYY